MECAAYNSERTELENFIIQEFGREEWRDRKQREDDGIGLILGINEYNGKIINKTKEFLRKVWKIREGENEVEVRRIRENDHNYF